MNINKTICQYERCNFCNPTYINKKPNYRYEYVYVISGNKEGGTVINICDICLLELNEKRA